MQDCHVFDNELTVFNYCLVTLDTNRHGGDDCQTMLLSQVLKTLSCWELPCTMVTVTVYVSLNFTVHLAATTHFVLQHCLVLFYRILVPLYSYSNFVLIL